MRALCSSQPVPHQQTSLYQEEVCCQDTSVSNHSLGDLTHTSRKHHGPNLHLSWALSRHLPYRSCLGRDASVFNGIFLHLSLLRQHFKYLQIIESQNGLGWKGPYRSSSPNAPCHGRGHLPQDQAAQMARQDRNMKAPSNPLGWKRPLNH